MEGALVDHEVLHSINSSNSSNFVIKLDMMKAYDRVCWKFFFKYLIKWVFPKTSANGLRHAFRELGFH